MGISIYAHRGNMSVFPENTFPAFESAIKLECNFIELDIQFTKDKQIVVTHDANAIRVTGQDAIISETNYNDLKKLNFGATFQSENNISFNELRLPLLSEVLEMAIDSGTGISIQPKCYGIVKPAFELLEKMKMTSQCGFNDTNCEYLIEARHYSNKLFTTWDRPPGTDFNTDLHIAKAYSFNTLMYEWPGITYAKIEKVKSENINFGACVINDLDAMKMYLEMGAESFYTDYPELLKSLV
ncbi:MAG: hypothetical protein H7321_06925 [Bacteroidia bacterium]|nr:hypothetical protein [Bacteroidia bacterium]